MFFAGLYDRLTANGHTVVTVKNTIGGASLSLDCSTTTFGDLICNLPGLILQGAQDELLCLGGERFSGRFRGCKNATYR